MASTDARPLPQKNVAYRVSLPIFDADGDLVTGATGLDSEISKDGGTFTDCTNEATEIATASGMYFLDLTSTEMNADTVVIIVKTTSTGAKTTPLVMYPEEAGDVRVNVTQVSGTTQTAGDLAALTAPAAIRADIGLATANLDTQFTNTQARLPAALVSGRMDSSVGAMAANVVTATAINADAITAAKLAADVTTEVQTGLATASALATVQADTDDIQSRLPAALVSGRMSSEPNAAAIRTGVGMASANLDTQLAAISAFIDTEVAAIKVVTDKLATTIQVSGPNWQFTVDALAQAPTGGGGGTTAAQVWDLADGIEVGLTPRQAMRLIAAVLAGDAVVSGNNIIFRNALADTKARINANVDVNGNRTFNSIDVT